MLLKEEEKKEKFGVSRTQNLIEVSLLGFFNVLVGGTRMSWFWRCGENCTHSIAWKEHRDCSTEETSLSPPHFVCFPIFLPLWQKPLDKN